jgi:glyoxylase-like metal-dependent hydrolase (beta-lactamase superfamily II)
MLPSGFIFLQRDWLSSNSLLLKQPESAYLFDSGYVTHAQQLVDFLKHQLGDQPLQVLINTHLHSDHCGGNALIQSNYEKLQVWVPATQFNAVNAWDEDALSYQITGQLCPRFQATDAVSPNDSLQIHGLTWKVFSSKGHDNDSLIFFQPDHGLLLSADALWENGLSVVFPEFLGGKGFEHVATTYDLIETLAPRLVLPGHGRMFTETTKALAISRQRLDYFVKFPSSHANYAARVLIKFKLMELQQTSYAFFLQWCLGSSLLQTIHAHYFDTVTLENWSKGLIESLATKHALKIHNGAVVSQRFSEESELLRLKF